jgi:GntR family transcriptional regulator
LLLGRLGVPGRRARVNTNTVLRVLRVLRDACSSSAAAAASRWPGTPAHGAVLAKARELVHFARRHGYRVDELVEIINDVARRPAAE